MREERRAYGVRWRRLGLITLLIAALNGGAGWLATVDAPFGLSGRDLIGVVVSLPEPTPPPASSPGGTPVAGMPLSREERGRVEQGGVRGIVFSPDGRTGWQFPRRPPESARAPGAPPQSPQTVVRPLALPRAGLDGAALYLATVVAMVGAGSVVLLLAPERVARLSGIVSGGAARLARLLAIGLVAYVGAAALAVLLVLIVTGLPLAAALVIALSVATILGVAAVAVSLGGQLLAWARVRQRRILTDFVVGMLLLVPLAAAPLAGWLVALGIGALGLGAVLISRFGAHNPFAADLERAL
ncbi:MAG: hypothetical protein RMM58_11530 [Chloroflexota bacterium]|nr:hypothetical protein [Dehalococcoidia bacterium]MDW8254495.1 hypothetical protein [Chloroflexota bacterium]